MGACWAHSKFWNQTILLWTLSYYLSSKAITNLSYCIYNTNNIIYNFVYVSKIKFYTIIQNQKLEIERGLIWFFIFGLVYWENWVISVFGSTVFFLFFIFIWNIILYLKDKYRFKESNKIKGWLWFEEM